jgi:hypothetical protein
MAFPAGHNPLASQPPAISRKCKLNSILSSTNHRLTVLW